MRAGARKQAHVPVGAVVLEPMGTAPGFLVGTSTAWSPCCPARRASCSACGPTRSTSSRLAGLLRVGRDAGAADPAVLPADASRRSRRRCARSMPTRCRSRSPRACAAASSRWRRSSAPAEASAYAAFEAEMRERHGDVLFSDDGATIDEVVARRLSGLTVATAESCTGGLMAGRLTDLAGSSAYVLGGLVVYSNEAKTAFAGVDPALIAAHGAVSPEVARALAAGARLALRRGPRDRDHGDRRARAAGLPEKPVGTVCLCVSRRLGRRGADGPACPGSRADVRDRTTTVALHMLRALLLRRVTAHRGEGSGVSRRGQSLEPRVARPAGVPLSVKLRAPESRGRLWSLRASTSDRPPITTALRTRGSGTNARSQADICSSPHLSACSFPRDPQEAGGRAWRPTNCQWPVP